MNHNDNLEYAKARLDLAKQMGDIQEMEKWSEHVWHWTQAEKKDNLIAAAPELLSACRSALAQLTGSRAPEHQATAAILRAAIANAEGRKQ